MDMPPPAPPEAPAEPQMQADEPAPDPPVPKFHIEKQKPEPVDKPAPPKKEMQHDFNALLNKLTAPGKRAKHAKAAAAHNQGHGLGQSDDRRSGGCTQKPDLSLLEPAYRSAGRPRPGGGL